MIPHKEIIFFDIKEKVFIDILSSRAIFAKIADLAGLLGKVTAAFVGCSLNAYANLVLLLTFNRRFERFS